MAIVTFTRAQRAGSHAIIGMVGESGTGKTYSAILLARGLVGPTGKLAMLDTETGRGKMYAHLAGGYDYAELTPPFTPERYIEAIKAAETAGFEALIIDSASHEWEGLGGVLEDADAGKSQSGELLKGLVKWAKPKARHKKFVQTLLNTRMHLIVCLRAKEKLEQKGDKIVSAGFVPVQDKRFKYELTVQMYFPNEGARGVPILTLPMGKCPEDLQGAFSAGQPITIETGRQIRAWVDGGAPVDHVLEQLKREAEDAADGGTEVLRALWMRLDRQAARALLPFMDNLKSIAASADREAAEEAAHTKFAPVDETSTDPLDAMFPADDAPVTSSQAAE